MHPIIPPSLAHNWEVVEALAGGGQSETFLVQSYTTKEKAVLKRIKHLESRVALERFKREITILKSIVHPNVVSLLASDEESTTPWYLSPAGEPLPKYWTRRMGDLNSSGMLDESARIIKGLLAGLATVHEKQIKHRDIKPENIIMMHTATDSIPVLIDFGLARRPTDASLTVEDGRQVHVTFGMVPAAWYWFGDDPPKYIDCFALALVWGWMLAREPRRAWGHYHWKYHLFIQDSRCERIRALWAACSHEEVAPPDASAMKTLVEDLFPGKNNPEGDKENLYTKAMEAAAEARMIRLYKRVQEVEHAESSAIVLGALLDDIQSDLVGVTENARKGGLGIELHIPKLPDHAASTILGRWAKDPNPVSQRVFDALFFHSQDLPPRDPYFETWLTATLETSGAEQFLPFTLQFNLEPHGLGGPGASSLYRLDKKGQFWKVRASPGLPTDKTVTKQDVAEQLRNWIADPQFWRPQHRLF